MCVLCGTIGGLHAAAINVETALCSDRLRHIPVVTSSSTHRRGHTVFDTSPLSHRLRHNARDIMNYLDWYFVVVNTYLIWMCLADTCNGGGNSH